MTVVYPSKTLVPVEHALLLCLKARRNDQEKIELARIVADVGPSRLLERAEENRVGMLVANVLVEDLELRLDASWTTRLVHNKERVERTLTSLTRVVRAANAEDAHIVVEGGGVLLASDLPMAAFCAGDIDVVVSPEAMPGIEAALAEARFVAPGRPNRQSTARREFRAEQANHEIWLAVGPHAFGRNWAEDSFISREPVWISGAVPARAFDDVRVPHPAQLLAMCATHTSTHSFVRSPGLRLQVDVDRLVTDNPIEWPLVVAELLAMRAARKGLVSLALARDLLGTEVPSTVDDALSPHGWRLEGVRTLLQAGGVFSHQPGVGRIGAAALDAILTDGGLFEWVRTVLLPSRAWLEQRSARSGEEPDTLLHLRRISHVLGRVS